jgi:hypothetical protein
MQASTVRHNALAQSFNDFEAGSSTNGSSARPYSLQSDAAEDAHVLSQLSAVLRERAQGPLSPSSVEAGGWDDMQLAALTRTADILVVAVGYPELVRCAATCFPVVYSCMYDHLVRFVLRVWSLNAPVCCEG